MLVEDQVAFDVAIAKRHRIESLLMKYPHISAEEKSEILIFIKHSPAIEPALLTCNEKISGQLEEFNLEFSKQLGFGSRDYGILVGIIASISIAIWLLWDFGI